MRPRILLPALLAVLLILTFDGCKSKKKDDQNAQRYPIEGVVMAVGLKEHTVTLKHHEVVGYMKAMTMPFTVKDEWVFKVVKPGDYIHATLVVGTDDDWLENVNITEGQAAADQSSTSAVHRPSAGDQVPDFAFTDQNGHALLLSQFRGQPLLLTFIYTRCPLPDFCIRMSNNFAQVAAQLKNTNPAAFAKLRLVSISIDPEHDTPATLLKYGQHYAAAADPKLQHWRFATGKPEEIKRAADFFGLSYTPQDGQIVHTLSTTLIDADGKVSEFYSGNQWIPGEVANKLASLQR
ncbi:MAG: SCO family protein [Acidobacteriota bacterium]|nr:SCO family protein [Acidobacteriota bacterium]